MPIEGFDYKAFAASMSEQAKELVPPELEDREKEYIVKTLHYLLAKLYIMIHR